MKCSEATCNEIALWTYVWPGRITRSWACLKHLAAATTAAGAMGFALGDARVCTLDEICRDVEEKEGSA